MFKEQQLLYAIFMFNEIFSETTDTKLHLLLSMLTEMKTLYPWPSAVAHWPMNSLYGMNNAVDRLHKDGTAKYFSTERGPYG